MNRIRKALDDVAKALGLQRSLLERARRRYRANRKRAFKYHEQAVKAEKRADRNRAEGGYNATQAPFVDRKAVRLHHKAAKSHARAQFWLGRIKVLMQRIHKLEAQQGQLQDELKKLDVRIEGNHAKGGTPKERWIAVCLASVANCAKGMPHGRRNFYSQAGTWDVDHVIRPGEQYGERSDCSSYVTSVAKAAGLPDPNGEEWRGGYTGTLIGEHNGWKRVPEKAMKRKGWGYVVYGPGVGHHVEAYIGPGERTAGHGSAPVDFGVINLFGDSDYRCYIHD